MNFERDDRILVIDPVPATRNHIDSFLTRLGFRVTAVDSIDAARPRLGEERYVTVLADLTGVESEGVGFKEELDRTNPDVPLIAMSADPTVRSVIASLRFGVFDYVIKPYEIQDLAAIVPKAVERYRAARQAKGADDGKPETVFR
jgi:DNA-binding NtrC family response regulator